jgi:hypothetical protein
MVFIESKLVATPVPVTWTGVSITTVPGWPFVGAISVTVIGAVISAPV